jgi:hypothetical protein
LLAVCPADDFQVVPVTIENWNSKGEKFTNKDFYAIHVLKCIQAIDEEITEALTSSKLPKSPTSSLKWSI